MKFLIKFILSALMAWAAGLLLIVTVLFLSNDGADFSLPDVMGFAGLTIIGSGILMLALYLPSFFWLRRRLGDARRYRWFPLLSGMILNAPVYLLLAFLSGRKMATSEALLLILSFLIIGLTFGFAFVFTQRTSKA